MSQIDSVGPSLPNGIKFETKHILLAFFATQTGSFWRLRRLQYHLLRDRLCRKQVQLLCLWFSHRISYFDMPNFTQDKRESKNKQRVWDYPHHRSLLSAT